MFFFFFFPSINHHRKREDRSIFLCTSPIKILQNMMNYIYICMEASVFEGNVVWLEAAGLKLPTQIFRFSFYPFSLSVSVYIYTIDLCFKWNELHMCFLCVTLYVSILPSLPNTEGVSDQASFPPNTASDAITLISSSAALYYRPAAVDHRPFCRRLVGSSTISFHNR